MTNRKQALYVIQRLRREGFDALLAGGCVRDRLLGRPASDYDVVTDAVPGQVIGLFGRTLKIGAQFGVVMVLLEGKSVEVATFRTEGGYQDGRRPGHVAFASAREDASRRDFTVNGMFFDPITKTLHDFVGGRADLEAGLLRTIGDPGSRFSDDYLRMLRAVRFAVKLDFSIDPETWHSMCRHASKIVGISAERISVELEEILAHPNRRRGAELLFESGLGCAIFREVSDESVRAALDVLGRLPRTVDFALAMAAFCSGLPTGAAMELCGGLKLSNAVLKHIRFLLKHRGTLRQAELPLSQLKLLMHEPYFGDLMTFERAILKAEGKPLGPLTTLRKRAMAIDPACVHPEPLLDGHALIVLGATPGPMVGRLARELYIAQLEGHLKTTQQARKWVLDWLDTHP
jgi:poly(A) polymerase